MKCKHYKKRNKNSVSAFGKWVFLVADTQLCKWLCPSVGWFVGRSVTLELKSGKTRISAPAHLSATGGRVSGLVELNALAQMPR